MTPGDERRVTVVVGASGGSGASLLAGALALSGARAGAPVWLLELDLERGDLGGSWDLPVARSLADLAAVIDELEGAHLRRAAHEHPSGVRLVLAPPAAGPADAWDVPAVTRLVDAAREEAGAQGRVVVDAGAGWLTAAGIAGARRVSVLVVCAPTLSGARRARRLVGALAAAGADARCALVVSEGAAGRGELGARALGRAVGAPVVAELPWRPREAAELGAGRWPRGGRARLAAAVEGVAGALG